MITDGIPQATWDKVNAIEGWLAYSAAHFTWALLRHQAALGIGGPIVEFGVFKGKYLSLLTAASAGTGARVYGYDGFFAGYNQPLDPQWIEPARATMVGNVNSVSAADGRLEIIHANTLSLTAADLAARAGGKIRFASVDAGHEADEVFHDMSIMSEALAEGGVIAADDVFNSVTPGVAEGLCRYLAGSRPQRIAAFATVGNKVFFTTPGRHADYLAFTKAFVEAGQEDYLQAARRHRAGNTAIGYAPRFFGDEIVPFAS